MNRHKAAIWAFASLALLAVAGGWVAWDLRRKNTRLETRVRELRHSNSNGQSPREREENRRLTQLIARLARNDAGASGALRDELEATRRELAEQERRAELAYRAQIARDAKTTENRDPTKGFARLEHLQNVGRATPAAAFQSTIWAALKGDEGAVVAAVTLTDGAREAAADLLSNLPASARAKFPSPESLAVLFVTDEVVKTAAIQVMEATITDPTHGEVVIRRLETGEQTTRIHMTLGPGGWQMLLSERAIESIRRLIAEPSP